MPREVANQAPSGDRDSRFRRESQAVLSRARERLGVSQREFARLLGDQLGHPVSQSQVSDWENGRFEPAASVVFAVAEIADTSIDELRGAGPPALIERMARLEARLEAIGDGAGQSLAAQEELARIGTLLVQIIEALDQAGLWPADKPGSARPAQAPRAQG